MQQYVKRNFSFLFLIILCFSALIGYLLPLVNIEVNLLGFFSESINFNIFTFLSIFNASDSMFSGGPLSEANMLELVDGNGALSNIGSGLAISAGLYLAVFILLIIVLVCLFTKKFKKTTTVMLAISFIFYIYIGYTVSSLPAELSNSLNNSNPFLSLLNVSDMLNITLRSGYWITIGAIGAMLLMKATGYVIARKSSAD